MNPSRGFSRWVALAILFALGIGSLAHPAMSEQPVREIVVHARRFAFVPSEITLKKGETVKLILISDDVSHGLAFQGLGIEVDILAGHQTELPLAPSQTGDFTGACSLYCGNGHRDMQIVIHVAE